MSDPTLGSVREAWLAAKTHHKLDPGYPDAQAAWDEIQKTTPDYDEAVRRARRAEGANLLTWGHLRAEVEGVALAKTGRLPP